MSSAESVSTVYFKDTATTEIYTLSLHDALPICVHRSREAAVRPEPERDGRRFVHVPRRRRACLQRRGNGDGRSEEHTSELQSRQYLVCRLVLEENTQPRPASSERPPAEVPPSRL